MGGRSSWLHSLVRFNRFDSPALEAQFQLEYCRPAIQAGQTWAAVELVVMLTNFLSAVVLVTAALPIIYWTLYAVRFGCVGTVLFFVCCRSLTVHHLKDVICACYCVCLATFGAQQCLVLRHQRQRGWGLTLEEPAATLLGWTMTYLCVSYYFILYQPLTIPMLQLGFCPPSLIAILCGPLVYVLMVTVGTGVFVSPVIFLPATVLIVGVQLFYCQRVAALRRAKFLLEVQKARHTQEMREADSIINHIVKNTMVEAAGLTEMFLELCSPPPPEDFVKSYLQCALERLRSGMAWCKRRRALLELMGAEARPTRTPTSLPTLGAALASNRTMVTDFANVVVELDEAVVDMMLENAISNAFRHGHPTDPAVHFLIVADVLDAATGSCAVTFRITNRCDPARQPLKPDIMEQLRRIDYTKLTSSKTFCHGLGLRHCLLAAELQGMTVSLAQQGDLVVFQASVVTRVVRPPPPPDATGPPAPLAARAPPLPVGLRIAVIDDSASARTLLRHQLCHDIPGCVVDVFGASADDVQPFVSHTVAMADIAILDQHLDWPSGSIGLGTDLVELL
eukprot:EG_transcript_8315